MGRWLNKIWIGLLAGTAFMASCSLVAPPPCYYGPPPVDPDDTVVEPSQNDRREMLRQRIKAINAILENRRNAEIYGPPEIMEEYARETMRLSAEADSLEQELKNLEREP